MGFDDYARLGVLINADEEIGAPGSAAFITQLGSDYDALMSFEAGSFQALATARAPLRGPMRGPMRVW